MKKTERVEIGKIKTHFKESFNGTKNPTKYRVVLIQEGLGNMRDCFFYTKGCLQNAAEGGVFEGKKCFADHPSSIEEQSRPERSTKDIIGHFENVHYEESDEGIGMLVGDLPVLSGAAYDWIRALLTNSLDYAKKYKEADFVGLSINAAGEAQTVSIDDFLKGNDVPQVVYDKLAKAKDEGITEIRPVTLLKEAISCDLVTEAGAGGKILKMIEGEKKAMKKKVKEEKKVNLLETEAESEEKKAHEGDEDAEGHDDEAQDKELFAKMIKQYLGDEHAESEEANEMAKHAYEAYQSEGMENEAAYEAAGKHLKMALKIGDKLSKGKADEPADKDKEEPADKDADKAQAEAKEKKESEEAMKKEAEEKSKESKVPSDLVKAKAEIAKLTEALKKYELTEYLDKKLSESKKPMHVTKKFREALGTPSSKGQIDEAYKIFMAAYESKVEEATEDSYFVFSEKTNLKESESTDGKVGTLADCQEK